MTKRGAFRWRGMSRPPGWHGTTWAEIVRETLTERQATFADPDPAAHHQAQPTRHDRPQPRDERHEPRTQL